MAQQQRSLDRLRWISTLGPFILMQDSFRIYPTIFPAKTISCSVAIKHRDGRSYLRWIIPFAMLTKDSGLLLFSSKSIPPRQLHSLTELSAFLPFHGGRQSRKTMRRILRFGARISEEEGAKTCFFRLSVHDVCCLSGACRITRKSAADTWHLVRHDRGRNCHSAMTAFR